MCCMEGISTLLSTGSASTLKMVIKSFRYNYHITMKDTRLSRLLLFKFIVYFPEELPEGFSQQMQEESQKSRPRFQPPAQQKPAALSPKGHNNTHKETTKVCVFDHKCELDKYVLSHYIISYKCVWCMTGHREG